MPGAPGQIGEPVRQRHQNVQVIKVIDMILDNARVHKVLKVHEEFKVWAIKR